MAVSPAPSTSDASARKGKLKHLFPILIVDGVERRPTAALCGYQYDGALEDYHPAANICAVCRAHMAAN